MYMEGHGDMMLKISEIALEDLRAKVIKLVADYNEGGVSDDDFYFTIGELGKDIADIHTYRNAVTFVKKWEKTQVERKDGDT